MKINILAIAFVALLAACDSKPKVIEAVDTTSEAQQPMEDASATMLHKVVVEEILPTSKYTYQATSSIHLRFACLMQIKKTHQHPVRLHRNQNDKL